LFLADLRYLLFCAIQKLWSVLWCILVKWRFCWLFCEISYFPIYFLIPYSIEIDEPISDILPRPWGLNIFSRSNLLRLGVYFNVWSLYFCAECLNYLCRAERLPDPWSNFAVLERCLSYYYLVFCIILRLDYILLSIEWDEGEGSLLSLSLSFSLTVRFFKAFKKEGRLFVGTV